MKTKTLIMSIMIAMIAITSSAFAQENRWDRSHPRRDQVNDRLHRQDARINHEYRSGEISRGQASRLHRDDYRIRTEERRMASHDGGHITRGESNRINHQENRVSRRMN